MNRFNRWEDALHEYEALALLEPENAEHYARQALAHSRLGQEEAMRRAAEQALRLDPNSSARALIER